MSYRFCLLTCLLLSALPACGEKLSDPIVGGQSGDEGAAIPAPCAPPGSSILLLKLTEASTNCIKGTVVEDISLDPVETRTSETLIGGAFVPFQESFSPKLGDTIWVIHQPAQLDGSACPEYQACSKSNCSNIDKESAPEDYDRCDTACLEENQASCALHSADNDFAGVLRAMPIDNGQLKIDWKGKEYSLDYEQLSSPGCEDYFNHLPDYRDPRSDTSSTSSSAATDSPAPINTEIDGAQCLHL